MYGTVAAPSLIRSVTDVASDLVEAWQYESPQGDSVVTELSP